MERVIPLHDSLEGSSALVAITLIPVAMNEGGSLLVVSVQRMLLAKRGQLGVQSGPRLQCLEVARHGRTQHELEEPAWR